MKHKKFVITSLIFILLASVISLTTSAETITDQRNDIWLQEKNDQTNKWVWIQNNMSNYSYIDITNVTYTRGDEFVIRVNFSDSINTSRILGVDIYYGSYSPYQYYRFSYTTDTNIVRVTSFGFSFSLNETLPNPLQNNNTQFSVITTLPIDDDTFSLWGLSYEYNEGYTKNWADFFPTSYEPTDVDFNDQSDQTDDNQTGDGDNSNNSNQNQTDNNGDNGDSTDDQDSKDQSDETPGFQIPILVVSMIILITYAFKRKK
jgi:hypothetical protein